MDRTISEHFGHGGLHQLMDWECRSQTYHLLRIPRKGSYTKISQYSSLPPPTHTRTETLFLQSDVGSRPPAFTTHTRTLSHTLAKADTAVVTGEKWLRSELEETRHASQSKRASGTNPRSRLDETHRPSLLRCGIHLGWRMWLLLDPRCAVSGTERSTCPICAKTRSPKLKLSLAPFPAIKVNRKIWMKSIP